ncbi:hypothetical protein NHF46_16575 [Arthrobacter alpinus]|nr:hypothetical protein [Arthrobacter alpinus]
MAPAAASKDALEAKVSTYHSYASGIVTDYGLRLGIERDAVVLGAAEAWQLASEVVEAHNGAHEHFTAAKSTLIQSVMDLAGNALSTCKSPSRFKRPLRRIWPVSTPCRTSPRPPSRAPPWSTSSWTSCGPAAL